MREACVHKGGGVELQVRASGNDNAVGFYKHIGADVVSRLVDGLVVGPGSWREPTRGNMMMRAEAEAVDARLGANKGKEIPSSVELVIADGAAQPSLSGTGTCGGAARSQRAQDLAERPKSARAVEKDLSGYARTGHSNSTLTPDIQPYPNAP